MIKLKLIALHQIAFNETNTFIHVQTLLQTIIVHVSQIVENKAAHKIATVKAAK